MIENKVTLTCDRCKSVINENLKAFSLIIQEIVSPISSAKQRGSNYTTREPFVEHVFHPRGYDLCDICNQDLYNFLENIE